MDQVKIDLDELKKIIEYHCQILAIKVETSNSTYLNKKDEFLTLVNFFSLLDVNFKDDLLIKLCDGILSLLNYLDACFSKIKSENNNDKIKEFSSLKRELLYLINTKLYYMDLYIWSKVEKSQFIKNYLRQIHLLQVKNSLEFFKKNSNFKLIVQYRYKLDGYSVYNEYSNEEKELLLSLDNFKERRKNYTLRRLIDSKDSISFFKNMEVEDIKHIVKDLEFVKFLKNEEIIRQGEETTQMYFLMSGKANVFVNNKPVGIIESDQIFGEFSAILGEKRQATVRAFEESTVLRFNLAFELFENDVYSFSMLYKNIINDLIAKILKVNTKKK